MNLKFYLALVACFILSGVNAQPSTYYQFFEPLDWEPFWWQEFIIETDTTEGNIWQVGPPQKSFFQYAPSYPNVIITDTLMPYPVNSESSFYFTAFPDLDYGILAIQWMQQIETTHRKDGGLVHFSSDGGGTWQNIFNNPYVYNVYGFNPEAVDTLHNGEVGYTGSDQSDVWLCFDYSWIETIDSLLLRFTFTSDSVPEEKDGWLLDSFLIGLTQVHTVREVGDTERLKVYPNPTTGRVHIEARKEDSFHIIDEMILIDEMGRIVAEWKKLPTKFFIDISGQKPGKYFLKVATNLYTETHTIIRLQE